MKKGLNWGQRYKLREEREANGKTIEIPEEPRDPKCFIYVRASTSHQVESPDTQQRICEEFVRRKGLPNPIVFADPSTSGKSDVNERAAGGKMLASLRAGDHIVVSRLDRISRSFIGFAKLLDTIIRRKVTIHICDMPGGTVDPNDPGQMAMAQMTIVFANYERALIVRRIREGFDNIRQQPGRALGGYAAPYGYKHEKVYSRRLKKHYRIVVPHEQEQAVLVKMVELHAAGMSFAQIANYLNEDWKIPMRSGKQWDRRVVFEIWKRGLEVMANQAGVNHAKQQKMGVAPEEVHKA
jgi:DNA invertase Pin-like site-specific DNA recombinase